MRRMQPVIESSPSAPPMDAGVRQVLLSALTRPWTALALVPGDNGVEVDGLARELSGAALETGTATRHVDARGFGATRLVVLSEEIASARRRGERLVISLDSPVERPAAMAALASLDAVVVGVRLGQSRFEVLRELLGVLPREKVLGAVLVGEASA